MSAPQNNQVYLSALKELEDRVMRIEKNSQAQVQMLSAQLQLVSAEQLRQQRENENLKGQILDLQEKAKAAQATLDAHNKQIT